VIALDGGTFLMGNDGPDAIPGDGEGPARAVRVAPFAIDPYAVTNHRFARFVEETGHVTDAEREGWSFVFAGRLAGDFPPTRALASAPWWRQVHGADRRHPDGPGTGARPDHPVVHVSHRDALAFCAWAGARLPAEAEWEYAARGGVAGTRFPWGDELGEANCNVFRGEFPRGEAGTVPVDAFAPNDFGLHNVIGNVWEWCADPFDAATYAIRGGSYTCHASHCTRYRLPARTGNAPDASMGNLGFRCVAYGVAS
jgi:formylglycine-generating enzyme required for sulfatase activity